MTARRMAAVAALAAAAVTVAAGVAVAARKGDPPARPAPVAITVTGGVEGLYPGADTTLSVTIANPYPFDVELRELDVAVDDASAICPAAAVSVGATATGQVIPGDGAAVVDLPVSMLPSAPDACQGARFAVRYTATVGQARSGPAHERG